MKLNKLGILTLCAMGLTACSSTDIDERVEQLNEARHERLANYKEQEQQRMEEELEIAPEWFLEPPAADATGFFGVGYAQSKNKGHALKLARLQAEFSLAKVYKQELSGSERAFERGDSEGNVAIQTTFLIDKIVDAVPVVGYDVIEQTMVPVDGKFETYVLLKLPYDEFNKVLQDQKKGEIDTTVQEAFDDLERRLKDRRAENEAALQAQHKRDLEAMDARNKLLKPSIDVEETDSKTGQGTDNNQ